MDSLKCILNEMTTDNLQKMLLFLKDPDNRANWLSIKEFRQIKNKLVQTHLYEDILVFSLLKINEVQLDPENYDIILKKSSYFLEKHAGYIRYRLMKFRNFSFQAIWPAFYNGHNFRPKNDGSIDVETCKRKCCKKMRINNICNQKEE